MVSVNTILSMPPAEQLYAENLALKSEVGGMRTALAEMHEELARLKLQLDWLRKRLFGPGRGEKLDRAQLLLQLEALEKIAARVNAPVQTVTYERAQPQPAARVGPAELFAKLPVKETIEL